MLSTAAGGRKSRKGRTSTVRPFTRLLSNSEQLDSSVALRLQRLRLLGISDQRAGLLADIVWETPMANPSTPEPGATPSLVWPAHSAEPNATTRLTADDLIAGGGAAALRGYLFGRFCAAETAEPGTPKVWTQFAVDHLTSRVADRADDGGIEVSTSGLQLVLAYVAWLEARGTA